MRRSLLLALGVPVLIAGVQQQGLLRRPPRVLALLQAPASSGPAALQARFSRPMLLTSLQQDSRLTPPLAHRWLGRGSQLLLALDEGERIPEPLELTLAGRGLRGLPLQPRRWLWDPRPRVVAVVRVAGGEQLQLRGHDGVWFPLSPIWPAIPVMRPLGDGTAVAVASRLEDGRLRLWRIPIRQDNLHSLAPGGRPAIDRPAAGSPQPLRPDPVIFAHFSSNRRGDLLIQSGGLDPGSSGTRLLQADGRQRQLPWRASGPLLLAPEGGAVLVPGADGLNLQALPPLPSRRQILPGSRDLSSFCPQAGRALLVRHWPDYRRSLELIEPGQPPRQLWLGTEAVLSSSCSRGGQRVWLLLLDGIRRPQLSLVTLDAQGRRLASRELRGWEAEPGTGLHWDPSTGRLLAVLRRGSGRDQGRQPPRAVLIDSRGLGLEALGPEVRQADWLPAG